MSWQINKTSNENVKEPILIEGLPGIGNVGKIATDYIIEKIGAKKIYEISSYKFPHCVFVNEKNLIELPVIEIYHKKIKNKSFLFLVGDVQPMDEVTCYEFCDRILDIMQKFKAKEIITIGGVATERIPKHPKVYCTGNNKNIIKRYKAKNKIKNLNTIVGPIIGVSGLLIGLAKKRKIAGISLLAETFAHPNYLGIKSAKEILKILNQKFNLKLKITDLEEEIIDFEEEFKKTRIMPKKIKHNDSNYIG